MTGFTPQRRAASWHPLAAATVAALALAGCNGTTYGTGKSPGMQTLEDIAGIGVITGKKDAPIDYSPRAKIVAPPNVAQLPPPGSGQTAAVAANWPKDPDVALAKIRADATDRERTGAAMPNIIVPKGPKPKSNDASLENRPLTPEEASRVKKLFADARGGVSYDESGNPVRKYLSDPPSEYRLPDPASPVEIIDDPAKKKKKKFKWWWQN